MTPNNEAKVTEHTPTPWHVDWFEPSKIRSKVKVHAMTDCVARVTTRDDAAFIVRAVNAHDALVAIAKKWRDEIMDDAPDDLGAFQIEILKEIEQALAEGRPE